MFAKLAIQQAEIVAITRYESSALRYRRPGDILITRAETHELGRSYDVVPDPPESLDQ